MAFPVPDNYRTATAIKHGNTVSINDLDGKGLMRLDLLKLLGKGGYGQTYLTGQRIDGKEVVVKIIERSAGYTTVDVIVEVISQILVVKETDGYVDAESGLKGPFAPKVFMFAKDDNFYYIVNERMHYDFLSIINKTDYAENLKNSIIQISVAMKILFEKLKFNHRDFKPDNIMFTQDGLVRIIDFGFCCLNYGGLQISSGYSFPKSLHNCNSMSRDMNALFYFFLNYTKYKSVSCPFKRVLRTLMYNKTGDPINWSRSYVNYNAKPELPNMFPENIISVFKALKFKEERGCSDFDPSWTKNIVEINLGVLSNIKNEEIAMLDKEKVKSFLLSVRSPSLTKRVLGVSSDPDMQEFCTKMLNSLDKTKKNGGKKRNKRRTLRTKRF